MSSHFDEKSGVIYCSTPWGKWYQTAEEVVIEILSCSEIRGELIKFLLSISSKEERKTQYIIVVLNCM